MLFEEGEVMGGFLYNGCGASDSYYPIKDLKEAYCNSCKTIRKFQLMELKRKIRVFWIPTLSIDTKYGIICPNCKTGWYVEEYQKDAILKGDMVVAINTDGVTLSRVQKKQQAPPPLQPKSQVTVEVEKSENTEKKENVLKSLSNTEKKENVEKDLSNTEKKEETIFPSQLLNRKICPSCKLMFMGDKTHCNICGRQLVNKGDM